MTQNNIIWQHKVFYLLDLIPPLIFSPKMPFSPYFRLLTNVKWQLPSCDDDVGDDDDDVGVAWIHLISWIAASPPAALKNSPLSRTDLRTEQAATLH